LKKATSNKQQATGRQATKGEGQQAASNKQQAGKPRGKIV
jgi:hypothetical protein